MDVNTDMSRMCTTGLIIIRKFARKVSIYVRLEVPGGKNVLYIY